MFPEAHWDLKQEEGPLAVATDLLRQAVSVLVGRQSRCGCRDQLAHCRNTLITYSCLFSLHCHRAPAHPRASGHAGGLDGQAGRQTVATCTATTRTTAPGTRGVRFFHSQSLTTLDNKPQEVFCRPHAAFAAVLPASSCSHYRAAGAAVGRGGAHSTRGTRGFPLTQHAGAAGARPPTRPPRRRKSV
jgi:hypothetical protein